MKWHCTNESDHKRFCLRRFLAAGLPNGPLVPYPPLPASSEEKLLEKERQLQAEQAAQQVSNFIDKLLSDSDGLWLFIAITLLGA